MNWNWNTKRLLSVLSSRVCFHLFIDKAFSVNHITQLHALLERAACTLKYSRGWSRRSYRVQICAESFDDKPKQVSFLHLHSWLSTWTIARTCSCVSLWPGLESIQSAFHLFLRTFSCKLSQKWIKQKQRTSRWSRWRYWGRPSRCKATWKQFMKLQAHSRLTLLTSTAVVL